LLAFRPVVSQHLIREPFRKIRCILNDERRKRRVVDGVLDTGHRDERDHPKDEERDDVRLEESEHRADNPFQLTQNRQVRQEVEHRQDQMQDKLRDNEQDDEPEDVVERHLDP